MAHCLFASAEKTNLLHPPREKNGAALPSAGSLSMRATMGHSLLLAMRFPHLPQVFSLWIVQALGVMVFLPSRAAPPSFAPRRTLICLLASPSSVAALVRLEEGLSVPFLATRPLVPELPGAQRARGHRSWPRLVTIRPSCRFGSRDGDARSRPLDCVAL